MYMFSILITLLLFLSSTLSAVESKSQLQKLQNESNAFGEQFRELFRASKKDEIVEMSNSKLIYLDSLISTTKEKDIEVYNWASHEYLKILMTSMVIDKQYTFDKKFCTELFQSIPPTSEIWSYDMMSASIPYGMSLVLKIDTKSYIDSMLLYYPKPKVRSKLICDLLMVFKRNDPDVYAHYYKMFLNMQDLPECREFKKTLDKQNPNIGKQLKPEGYTNSEKKECSIEFKNYDFYIVDCWTTWCGPCINEMDQIEKIYLAQDTSKVKFIGICIDDEIEKGSKIVNKKFHKNWLALYSVDKNQKSFTKEYNIHSYPHKMILDSEGKILYDKVYIFELEAILNKILNK